MTSANHPEEDDEEMELFQSNDDSWIRHLNAHRDTHFEQWEPPTADKIIYVNLVTKENPKPILINENLSPSEKEGLIQLIR